MKKQPFQQVILYARQHRANQGVSETLHRLAEYLQTMPVTTVQDLDTKDCFDLDLPVFRREPLDDGNASLIVVVGGDGSLLSAARMAIMVGAPVIGVNRGRLGFLTDISPQALEQQLGDVLSGNYLEESRFLLETTIVDNTTTLFQGHALNDVVLSRGNETHLIEFDVHVDNQYVSHYRADGLILATPTGSTAYALSAGGPIMHPQLNAIVIVPMFSHSLSSRPLVIDAESVIDVKIRATHESHLQISCDGHESPTIQPGQQIVIKKNVQKLRLLHPTNYHYYDTLRLKLGWGSKT